MMCLAMLEINGRCELFTYWLLRFNETHMTRTNSEFSVDVLETLISTQLGSSTPSITKQADAIILSLSRRLAL
jgi:hypothetical protein